jgi:hypothetical protein
MNARDQTDPALDLATAFLLRYNHAGGVIAADVIDEFRQRDRALDAAQRERFRAIVVERLTTLRGLNIDEATRLVDVWFPT